jgi:hypothetical protein
MTDKEELLAQYHHTISEQLNSRLSESPKFFGLLIIVSTGYGYVLSNHNLSCNKELFMLASLLSYATVLWAGWYLAALGYSFRFLQNCQHCMGHALKWRTFGPRTDEKERTKFPFAAFWLLPSIYHPHACGLFVFLAAICGVFYFHVRRYWGWSWGYALLVGMIFFLIGAGLMYQANRVYKIKYYKRRRDPDECTVDWLK